MVVCRLTKPKRIPERLFQVFFPKREISVRPRNFDAAAKEYINALLDSMGRDESKTTVIDQLFCANNPAKGFKYVDNPKAVVVDRDPRDCYLFCKIFLKSRGAGLYAATDTVEDFISWFKAMRTEPDGLREREDILFMNFEELLYDYDNSVPKIAEFCGVSRHTAKGEFFKPKWSRNNSQLFKKYKGYEEDIGKIEKELPDYLFPFEKYPDIETEGEMFFGNQSKRGRI
ncbi:MAG: sulfotransferase domain-containing protein [Oscillospiraceae bacterium]|nr:sulfotransferase domain-containing protein [Oscillospiraceae bacterium]